MRDRLFENFLERNVVAADEQVPPRHERGRKRRQPAMRL